NPHAGHKPGHPELLPTRGADPTGRLYESTRPDARAGQPILHDRACRRGYRAHPGAQSPAGLSHPRGSIMRPMDSGQPVIDCDIHTAIPSAEALSPFLSQHWREYIRTSAFKGAVDTAYPPNAPTTRGPSDLEAVRREVLEPWSVELGIL